MMTFECSRCATQVSFRAFWPDACSSCGGTLRLVGRDEGGAFLDALADEFDVIHYENMGKAAAADFDAIGDHFDAAMRREEREALRSAALNASVAAGVCLLIVISVIWLAWTVLRADAMGACQAAHSFDVCHHTLNR